MRKKSVHSVLMIIGLCCLVGLFGVNLDAYGAKVEVSPGSRSFSLLDDQGKTICQVVSQFDATVRSVAQADAKGPLGSGTTTTLIWSNGWTTQLAQYDNCPFVQLSTTVHVTGKEPLVVASLDLYRIEVDLGVPTEKLRSFGTGFLKTLDKPSGSFTFTTLVDPETRAGLLVAQLTHEQSSGVFTTQVDNGKTVIDARLDFGRYEVQPGKSRETDTLLIGRFDDTRLGLEAYADAVAKYYGIKLKEEPGVYCTWYHAGASDEKRIAENSKFVENYLKPFGMSVMQIDDLWQEPCPAELNLDQSKQWPHDDGPFKVFVESRKDNYPSGMAHTAEEIAKCGLTPGIWFMPFAGDYKSPYFKDRQDLFAHWQDGQPIMTRWSGSILDMTNPKTEQFVYDRVKRIYDWGYRYFKLDGMHTGAVTHNVYINTGWSDHDWQNTKNFIGLQNAPGHSQSNEPSTALHDPTKTHIQAYRTGLDAVRRAAPDVFILGCNVSQNMRSMGAMFDKIDAMRIGPDNGFGSWGQATVGARHGSNLYFLNDRVWHNDPDPVYVRSANKLETARMMVSWVAVSGSMLTASYQFADLPQERLDLLRRALPDHNLKPRPVDLFEQPIARIWLLSDTRHPVRRDVIGLFNWDEKNPAVIEHMMDRIGLDADASYVAFDFWANRFLEQPIQGTLHQELPGGTCRILAVRPESDHPQLLSTSRHITQGMVDVLDEQWDAATKTLSGRSLVVADDPYELRIALPRSGKWQVSHVEVDGDATITPGEATPQGVRILITPTKTQEVSWKVIFKTVP